MSTSSAASVHRSGPRVASVLRIVDGWRCSDQRPEYLSMKARVGGDGLHFYELGGELDIAGAGYVLNRLCEDGGSAVVDLSRLTFIDAAGISALLAARHNVDQRGGRFELHGATGFVRRVFDVVGVTDMLEG